jgi:hypothetical protein
MSLHEVFYIGVIFYLNVFLTTDPRFCLILCEIIHIWVRYNGGLLYWNW